MKPRHKKLAIIASSVTALGVASVLVLNAFQSNLVFFFSPTQVANNEAPMGKSFRIGGLVEEGSVKRQRDGVTVSSASRRTILASAASLLTPISLTTMRPRVAPLASTAAIEIRSGGS